MTSSSNNLESIQQHLHNTITSYSLLKDCLTLLSLFERWTNYSPTLYQANLIGYGQRTIKVKQSNQEKNKPLVGFTPKRNLLLLHVFSGVKHHEYLLENLGHFKRVRNALQVQQLSHINLTSLEMIVYKTIEYHQSSL
ncbi:hypothetical protein ACYSNM_12580 [Myroides sp. LJL116]